MSFWGVVDSLVGLAEQGHGMSLGRSLMFGPSPSLLPACYVASSLCYILLLSLSQYSGPVTMGPEAIEPKATDETLKSWTQVNPFSLKSLIADTLFQRHKVSNSLYTEQTALRAMGCLDGDSLSSRVQMGAGTYLLRHLLVLRIYLRVSVLRGMPPEVNGFLPWLDIVLIPQNFWKVREQMQMP